MTTRRIDHGESRFARCGAHVGCFRQDTGEKVVVEGHTCSLALAHVGPHHDTVTGAQWRRDAGGVVWVTAGMEGDGV